MRKNTSEVGGGTIGSLVWAQVCSAALSPGEFIKQHWSLGGGRGGGGDRGGADRLP